MGVVGAAFLLVAGYFLFTGASEYYAERQSFFAFLFADVPNWNLVKGFFFLGLGLGLGLGEWIAFGIFPKSTA